MMTPSSSTSSRVSGSFELIRALMKSIAEDVVGKREAALRLGSIPT
jgi:hypothetical protein